MKIFKPIFISLIISFSVSLIGVSIFVKVENSLINKTISSHFTEGDCLSAGIYIPDKLFNSPSLQYMKIFNVDNQSFKVDYYIIKFQSNKESSYITPFLENQRLNLQQEIINNIIGSCNEKNSELKFVFRNGALAYPAMSAEDYNQYYNFKFYYLTQYSKSGDYEYSNQNNYWNAEISNYTYLTKFKLDFSLIVTIVLIATFIPVFITLIISLLLRRRNVK